MTSSDQSNEVLTNQATKTKINVTLLALVSRSWYFLVVAAFVVPRFPPIGYFAALSSRSISRYFIRRIKSMRNPPTAHVR